MTTHPGPLNGVAHYENFPVASWLCPTHLRAPIVAIYHFARCADDLADEGNAPASQRLGDLAQFRADLEAGTSQRWPHVFAPLATALASHALPVHLLHALLDAFEQDVRYTAAADKPGHRYANTAELLAYCAKSANPVGRLLLHLYGVNQPEALERSDAVCSALQLINFWQDLGRDVRQGRYYLPLDLCAKHGLGHAQMLDLANGQLAPAVGHLKLIAENLANAETLMRKGSKIAFQVPGRAGWELRAVIQGGLRIAHRIEQQGYNTWQQRPKLGKTDVLAIGWAALWMHERASDSPNQPA